MFVNNLWCVLQGLGYYLYFFNSAQVVLIHKGRIENAVDVKTRNLGENFGMDFYFKCDRLVF